MKKFEKGYLIEITSWENDADNRKTVSVCCKEKHDAEMIVKFINYFKSASNDYSGKLLFGNATSDYSNKEKLGRDKYKVYYSSNLFGLWLKDNDKELFDWLIKDLIDLGIEIEEELKSDPDFLDDIIGECVYEWIGFWCDGDCVRVLDNYKVYHIPETVVFKKVDI